MNTAIKITEISAQQPVTKCTGNAPGRSSVSEWYGFASFRYQYRADPPSSKKKKGRVSRTIKEMIRSNSVIVNGGGLPGGTLLYSKSVTANSESVMVVLRGGGGTTSYVWVRGVRHLLRSSDPTSRLMP